MTLKDRVASVTRVLPWSNSDGSDGTSPKPTPQPVRLPPMVMMEGTPRERMTVCPKCGGTDIDDIIYRGTGREEFVGEQNETNYLKPLNERPPEVLIGQVCRTWVPVSETVEEPCGYRLWSTPVYIPAKGRRLRGGQ